MALLHRRSRDPRIKNRTPGPSWPRRRCRAHLPDGRPCICWHAVGRNDGDPGGRQLTSKLDQLQLGCLPERRPDLALLVRLLARGWPDQPPDRRDVLQPHCGRHPECARELQIVRRRALRCSGQLEPAHSGPGLRDQVRRRIRSDHAHRLRLRARAPLGRLLLEGRHCWRIQPELCLQLRLPVRRELRSDRTGGGRIGRPSCPRAGHAAVERASNRGTPDPPAHGIRSGQDGDLAPPASSVKDLGSRV